MKRVWLSIITVAVAASSLVFGPAPGARAATPLKVTVTIHDIWEVNCDDNNILDINDSCGNDYYAKVFTAGRELPRSPRAEDHLREVHPHWQLSHVVDADQGKFPIRIQLWDHDSSSGDDLVDIADGDDNLDIVVDPLTGDFTGDIRTPSLGYSAGTGKDAAAVYFTVTLGDSVDFDADGIPDQIEQSVIVDRNGNVPAHGDLGALRSNPCRPTVLVEADYMEVDRVHSHKPLDDTVKELVSTFDNADIPARPDCPYGGYAKTSGAQLILVVDQALTETDKISWNSPAATNGQKIRDANFNGALRPYFHYSLWAHNQPDIPGKDGAPASVNSSSGLCCSNSGKDVLVTLGAWTNNVGTVREQSGTFLHELGHSLGLGHGGLDDINCKPNYHSAMSYVYQTTGIPDAALPAPTVDLSKDGKVDDRDKLRLDYSRAALLDLDEDALDEEAGIGGGPDIFFWDNDGTGKWQESKGDAKVDWNLKNGFETENVPGDVNFMGIGDATDPDDQGCARATPPKGTPGAELKGHDDWDKLQYKAPLAPPSKGHDVSSSHEMTKEEADFVAAAIHEALSRTDLAAGITDAPDPVGAGGQLTYTLSATNAGSSNPGYLAKVVQTLPPEVTFVSASSGCTPAGGTVTCALGQIAPGATATATVTVAVPADLVFNHGGPKDITSSVTVSHDGTDSALDNNSTTATTRVIAMADLETESAAIIGAPAEMIIGTPAQFTLRRVVDNNGPSTPVNATISTTGSASAGAAVQAPGAQAVPAMVKDTPRTIDETVTVTCAAPGAHTFILVAGIAPASADDVDPDPANNTKTVSTTIDCVVPVAINIRPHHTDNRFSASTHDVNVGLLTTTAGEYGLPLAFDASRADVASIRFGPRDATFAGGGAPDRRGKGDLRDSWERYDEAVRDGDIDLEVRFVRPETDIPGGQSEACMKGTFTGPAGETFKFFGCDTIVIHPSS